MLRLLLCAVASWLVLGSTTAHADDKDDKMKALRENVLKTISSNKADEAREGAEAYKKLFLHVGRDGLKSLLDDKDTSIALQAAWEFHKKVVKRPKLIPGRTDWVFEREATKKFLDVFGKRTGMEPPEWWRSTLLAGEVFPEQHHAFITTDTKGLPQPKIEVGKDHAVITVGKESIKVSKAEYEKATEQKPDENPIALIGTEQSYLAIPTFRGYPFEIMCIDSKTAKVVWKVEVWAARRGFSSGPGGHTGEIRLKGDTVIIYGCESHGIYAEGFDAKTGKCVFRFCSCYWFNFSEAWGLK